MKHVESYYRKLIKAGVMEKKTNPLAQNLAFIIVDNVIR